MIHTNEDKSADSSIVEFQFKTPEGVPLEEFRLKVKKTEQIRSFSLYKGEEKIKRAIPYKKYNVQYILNHDSALFKLCVKKLYSTLGMLGIDDVVSFVECNLRELLVEVLEFDPLGLGRIEKDVFESEERIRWRTTYQKETENYSKEFLAALHALDLLEQIKNQWGYLGLVGIANKLTLTFYCCLTKDLLPYDRVHNVWWGDSRGGKNTPLERLLKSFDPAVVEAFTRVTPTFIDHCPELTDGKIFYLNQFTQRERNSKGSEYMVGDEILDLLLSEGDRVLGTVVRNKPMRLRLHGKPLFISTTNYKPRITTSSRLQLTHADESFQQTTEIMLKKGDFRKTGQRPPEFSPFLMQLTHWFRDHCKKKVIIPWAKRLAEKLVEFAKINKALRWRDDIDRIFAWIVVDALLHQEQLLKTEEGYVVAAPQQWMNVLKLVEEDLIATIEELSPAAQEIYKTILNERETLESEEREWFSSTKVAKLVAFSKSTVTHAMKGIRNKGLLIAEQDAPRKPWRYKIPKSSEGLSCAATDLLSWTDEELGNCFDDMVARGIPEQEILHLIKSYHAQHATAQDTPDSESKSESEQDPVAPQRKVTEFTIPRNRESKLELILGELQKHPDELDYNQICEKVKPHNISGEEVSEYLLELSKRGIIYRGPDQIWYLRKEGA